MAVINVSKGLSGAALFVCIAGLLAIAIAISPQAFASGTVIVTITAPASAQVNTNNAVTIYLHDSTGAIKNTAVTLSVSSPDSASTITSSVTTNTTGYATATLHLSTKAGNNVITASGPASSTATVYAIHGTASSLSLTLDHKYRLADGYSKSLATATLADQYGNPVNNTVVNIIIDGTSTAFTTDNSGNASQYTVPFTSYHVSTVNASYGSNYVNSSVTYLEADNLILLRYPGDTTTVNSNVGVTAVFYSVFNTSKAAGIPLTFTAYAPDFSQLSSSTGTTDINGKVNFNFTTSSMVGNNTIIVTNPDLGMIGGTVIYGSGGTASGITTQTTPSTPVLADGVSSYVLKIWVKDAGNNPVVNEPVSIVMHASDFDHIINQTTNSAGLVEVNTGPSLYVQNIPIVITDINNPNVNATTTIQYTAGPPTSLTIKADPAAVASSNIANIVSGSSVIDVHETDLRATVTDKWGHPLANQPVTLSSLNTTAGTISGPITGVTDGNGDFPSSFELGSYSNGTGLVTVKAVSGTLSSTVGITYTDVPFLSVKTGITPRNALINGTISVNINVTGIGYMIRAQPLDVMLVMDKSGSMDWYSTTVNGTFSTGNANGAQIPDYGSNLQNNDYRIVGYFNNTGYKDFEIMLSSSYNDYSSYGSFYRLKVKMPSGVNTTDDTSEASGTVEHSSNENIAFFHNAANGTYTIMAAYKYSASQGNTPYYMSVVIPPKRLGGSTETSTAAKIAAEQCMNNLSSTMDQVGLASFDTDGTLNSRLLLDNNTSKVTLFSKVEALDANGGTQINTGLDTAIAELQAHNRININNSGVNGKKVIILLTDGYSQSPTADITSANTAKADGITIYTIGMGMADQQTLYNIASITGGSNYTAVSDLQLNQAYSDILSDLKSVVANSSTMYVSTNRSVVNGTISSDAEYVPGSAVIRNPNGTTFYSPTSDPTKVISDTQYTLIWNPGAIKLNEMWNLTYQLKVLRNGTINPINNNSYVVYYRSDNGINTTYYTNFGGDAIYVNSSLGPNLTNSSGLISITNAKASNSSLMQLSWHVDYNGTTSYVQDISIMGSDGVIIPIPSQYYSIQNLGSNRPSADWVITVDTRRLNNGKGLKPGVYTEINHAQEINGGPEAFAYPTFSIPNSDNGNIVLE